MQCLRQIFYNFNPICGYFDSFGHPVKLCAYISNTEENTVELVLVSYNLGDTLGKSKKRVNNFLRSRNGLGFEAFKLLDEGIVVENWCQTLIPAV